jgi:hypothetical protein
LSIRQPQILLMSSLWFYFIGFYLKKYDKLVHFITGCVKVNQFSTIKNKMFPQGLLYQFPHAHINPRWSSFCSTLESNAPRESLFTRSVDFLLQNVSYLYFNSNSAGFSGIRQKKFLFYMTFIIVSVSSSCFAGVNISC